MKKSLGVLAAVAVAIVLSASPARADLISINMFEAPGAGNPAGEAAMLEGLLGLEAGSLTYLAKYSEGWDGDYSAYFNVDNDDMAEWLVSWDLEGSGYTLAYALAKDGNNPDTGYTYYHLYGVTLDQVVSSGGWQQVNIGNGKNVSHVTFFSGPTSVPDGGMTLMLLGGALVGVGALRRKFRA